MPGVRLPHCKEEEVVWAMKIWVDDLRTPPNDGTTWEWCKSSRQAIWLLSSSKYYLETGRAKGSIGIMSLDHDLGGDDTTRPIVLWMIENDFWPVEVRVHTANPVGRAWLEGMIERYKDGLS